MYKYKDLLKTYCETIYCIIYNHIFIIITLYVAVNKSNKQDQQR